MQYTRAEELKLLSVIGRMSELADLHNSYECTQRAYEAVLFSTKLGFQIGIPCLLTAGNYF